MKLISNMICASLLVVLMSLTAFAADKTAVAADKTAVAEKPLRQEGTLLTVEATIESIDRETRQVTLKNEEGETVSITLDGKAGRIDDIETGDQVVIEYLEVVTIQVFGADEVEPGATGEAIAAGSEPGEKPAALAVEQVSVVVTIEAIDLEKELVTLKNKEGEVKTVSPKYPENLKKVKVGDRVMITHTSAVGFSVTEKPAVK
ncbi:MAG: hypothetical protein U9R57_10240 [Thermodesulfobacteriota bacterium]|nr:hypothetical protein [Thermodesulfobacteriota bacterium]